jgi:hypothetical protein
MTEKFLKILTFFIVSCSAFGMYITYGTDSFNAWVIAFAGWTLILLEKNQRKCNDCKLD